MKNPLHGSQNELPSREEPGTAADHLSLEVLLELSLDQLPSEQAFEAREHLLSCSACLGRARSLMELPEPEDPLAIKAGRADREAAWQDLQRQLPLPSAPSRAAAAARPEDRLGSSARIWPQAMALAAMLLAGIGLGFWLRGEGANRSPDMVLAVSTHLLPLDFSVLGTLPAPPTAACPPAEGVFLWILGGLEGGSSAGNAFEIELHRPRWGTLRTTGTANEFGEIELTLRRSALPSGSYRILVKPAGRNLPAKEYRLAIDCP